MKKYFILSAIAAVFYGLAFGQTGNFILNEPTQIVDLNDLVNESSRTSYFEEKWAKSGGTNTSPYNQFNGIVTDNSGNTFLVGVIQGNATLETNQLQAQADN